MSDDHFFSLSPDDRREVILTAASRSGRPANLLEKDVWVVWALNALFSSHLANKLTFKGGTSLSKAYKVINRFSEDIDLTYDIRQIIDGFGDWEDEPEPRSRNEAKKWSERAREALGRVIVDEVQPILQAALQRDGILDVSLKPELDRDRLLLEYPLLTEESGYIPSRVLLEFGARSTGEPNSQIAIACDMDAYVSGVILPTAAPQVMSIARTFWEKATAAHVYCAQNKLRGERYARHWYDLAELAKSTHYLGAIEDRAVALRVARHKSWFFREKGLDGEVIDYMPAVQGQLRLVPEGEALAALRADYVKMTEEKMLIGEGPDFDVLMDACRAIEAAANSAATAVA